MARCFFLAGLTAIAPAVASPVLEEKREDLTERLKKEFGLSVDDDDDGEAEPSKGDENPLPTPDEKSNLTQTDGDATPELDNEIPLPAIPPVVSVDAAVPSAISDLTPHSLVRDEVPYGFHPPQKFVPSQYPSYPPSFSGPKSGMTPLSSSSSRGSVDRDNRSNKRDYYASSSTSASQSTSNRSYYSSSERSRSTDRGLRRDRDFRDHNHHNHHHYSHHHGRDHYYRDRDYRDFGHRSRSRDDSGGRSGGGNSSSSSKYHGSRGGSYY